MCNVPILSIFVTFDLLALTSERRWPGFSFATPSLRLWMLPKVSSTLGIAGKFCAQRWPV